MAAVCKLTYVHLFSMLLTQAVLLRANGVTDFYDKDFCVKKADDDYADPDDCRSFYQCSNGYTYHRSGNPNNPNLMFDPDTKKFEFGLYVNCAIKKVFREIYVDIPGSQVKDLENSLKFPCSPLTTSFLDSFCTYHLPHRNLFGQRLRSFFRAPETGDYIFQSSCDDTCKVFLSTDSKPENKRLIIHQQKRSAMLSWNNKDQTSEPVSLIGNHVYYMEALHKDGPVTTSFVCIGARYPSGKPQRPISSRHFVLDEEGVKRLGCTGSVKSGIKKCMECTRQNTVKDLEQRLLRLKRVIESSPTTEEYRNATKESAAEVNSLLGQMTSSTEGMRIAWLLEDFGSAAAKHWSNSTNEISFSLPNLAINLRKMEQNYRFPNSQGEESWGRVMDFIELKATNYNNEMPAVFSAIYNNSFNKFIPQMDVKPYTLNSSSSSSFRVNSRIIGSLLSRLTSTFKVDVTVQLSHLKAYDNDTEATPFCVWWDYSASGGAGGRWSTEGCVKEQSNQSHTTCRCSHLTHFAILMQLKDVQIEERHQRALEIITYVGCGLSIFAISVTVLVLGCLSGLRSERNLIHLNLSLSIGILQVIFLAGVTATENKVACTAVAVLLHYFCLASFAWMLVEGVYLYTMVIKVFDSDKERFKYYLATAYSLPALIVVISAASVQLNGYGTDISCWLSQERGLIYAFVAPALAIVLVNTIILTMVIIEIIKIQANSYQDNSKLVLLRSGVKSVVILLPLLGTTWVFGVLTMNQETVAFQYLFAIFNSLQGLFLFIFHCLLNSEVRKAVKRKKEIWYSRKTASVPSTSLFPSTWRKAQTNVSVDALDTLANLEDRKISSISNKLQCSMEKLNITAKESPKTNQVKSHDQTTKGPKDDLAPFKESPAWERNLGTPKDKSGPSNQLPPIKNEKPKMSKK